MPPSRTIIRGRDFTSVTDLTTSQRGFQKPNDQQCRAKNKYYFATKEKNGSNECEQRHFMDLDEFLQKAENNYSSSENTNNKNGDVDYPKPTIDLLASLQTLGKMITNQRQLIQNQSTCIISPGEETKCDAECDNMSVSSKEKNNLDQRSLNLSVDKLIIEKDDKKSTSSVPDEIKDIDYWDRRKRNNLAAKKSREERRKKELEVVETTKQLETQNSQLTLILKRLTSRNEWLESRIQDIRLQRIRDLSSSLSSSAEES